MNTVNGTFDVQLDAQPMDGEFYRMTIAKTFSGDLEATSAGVMLSAGTPVEGSAGYVAVERVTGTLGGRSGTFVLQHFGIMNRGELSLTITVVPDSGTDGLAGLTGTMTIDIVDGEHRYGFAYEIGG